AATLAAATVAATAPAPAAGNPLATAAAAAAGHTAEARGLQGLPGVERGMPAARNDMAGVYTGEGPHRRGLRGTLKALPGGLAGHRGWAGGFALAGLVAALGAWAFARARARGRAEHDADGGDEGPAGAPRRRATLSAGTPGPAPCPWRHR